MEEVNVISIIGAIICFNVSSVAGYIAACIYYDLIRMADLLERTDTSSVIAIAQRYTMICGFFAWFGVNLLA